MEIMYFVGAMALVLMYAAERFKVAAFYLPSVVLILWVGLFIGEFLVYLGIGGYTALAFVRFRALMR